MKENTMSFVQELSLLVAIATPIATIATINLSLYLAGERATLLVPIREAFPA
jgi:hypothetical protein